MSIRSHWPLSTSTAHGTSPPSESSPLYGRSYSVVIVVAPTRASSPHLRDARAQQVLALRQPHAARYAVDHLPRRVDARLCLLNTGDVTSPSVISRSSKSQSSGLPVALYLIACARW